MSVENFKNEILLQDFCNLIQVVFPKPRFEIKITTANAGIGKLIDEINSRYLDLDIYKSVIKSEYSNAEEKEYAKKSLVSIKSQIRSLSARIEEISKSVRIITIITSSYDYFSEEQCLLEFENTINTVGLESDLAGSVFYKNSSRTYNGQDSNYIYEITLTVSTNQNIDIS